MLSLIPIIQLIIQTTPEAIALWNSVQGVLKENRDPTKEEWDEITAKVDAYHQSVQSAGD